MIKYIVFLLIASLALGLTGCKEMTSLSNDMNFESDDEQIELVVGAAASLMDVMGEISQLYREVNPHVKLTFTFGSSGALMAQIQEGAPIDVFISAAQNQMDILQEEKLIMEDTRKDVFKNELVLITPKSSQNLITNFEDIVSEEVKNIALGEPGSVPAGQYAKEILENLGIWNEVETKSVFASDVRQVMSWVELGETDCGIVYATDAAISDLVSVVAKAPEGTHKPVIYPAALIENIEHLEEGKEFLEFLSSEEVKVVLNKYGFGT